MSLKIIFHTMCQQSASDIVSSPDLVRHVYRLQYNVRAILKAIRAGVGFGSGTETTSDMDIERMF